MDKARFLTVAPAYYALAVAVFFKTKQTAQISDIVKSYSYEDTLPDSFEPMAFFRLKQSELFEQGLRILIENGLIEIIEDEFGPLIMVRSESFDRGWDALSDDRDKPFDKYNRLGKSGDSWLFAALDKLNATHHELGVDDQDFAQVDAEWEPLPLDRKSAELTDAVEALTATIQQVERDNGYAAKLPEERDYILGSLKQTLSRLKEDTEISIAYLRIKAFDPLLALTRRFAGAAN